ncbi:MAG: class I SAM-dependent methyltransferase [Proteobacteria bacterium]|nr:class I SAM-dependent methyltransferase [Pseudomonadota bacterium]MBU1715145.1 class I SAM-dependent methyltransferase [Pseudomonadota bacterium]
MHQSSYANMLAFRQKYLAARRDETLQILDIGSYDVNGSYKAIFNEEKWCYRGVDISEGPNVSVILSDLYNWREIKSSTIDLVISGQAFEHIEYVWLTMLEIYRVLKPGGLCCIIAPSGGEEHRYPVDCWRFYGDGFKALARYASLDLVEVYTQEQAGDFSDDSNSWKDTVFIGKKPCFNLLTAGKARLKHLLIRKLSKS